MRPYPHRYQRTPPAADVDVRKLLEERQLLLAEVERLRGQNARLLFELQDTEQLEEDAVPAEDVALLARRIEELTKDLTRVQQRTALEVEEAKVAQRSLHLARLGDVLDSVQSALEMSSEGAPQAWLSGMLGIERQLLTLFREEGATLTGELGKAYDPMLHEGVAMVADSGVPSGRIAKVVRQGIVLDDGRVARTAQVCIAA